MLALGRVVGLEADAGLERRALDPLISPGVRLRCSGAVRITFGFGLGGLPPGLTTLATVAVSSFAAPKPIRILSPASVAVAPLPTRMPVAPAGAARLSVVFA